MTSPRLNFSTGSSSGAEQGRAAGWSCGEGSSISPSCRTFRSQDADRHDCRRAGAARAGAKVYAHQQDRHSEHDPPGLAGRGQQRCSQRTGTRGLLDRRLEEAIRLGNLDERNLLAIVDQATKLAPTPARQTWCRASPSGCGGASTSTCSPSTLPRPRSGPPRRPPRRPPPHRCRRSSVPQRLPPSRHRSERHVVGPRPGLPATRARAHRQPAHRSRRGGCHGTAPAAGVQSHPTGATCRRGQDGATRARTTRSRSAEPRGEDVPDPAQPPPLPLPHRGPRRRVRRSPPRRAGQRQWKGPPRRPPCHRGRAGRRSGATTGLVRRPLDMGEAGDPDAEAGIRSRNGGAPPAGTGRAGLPAARHRACR